MRTYEFLALVELPDGRPGELYLCAETGRAHALTADLANCRWKSPVNGETAPWSAGPAGVDRLITGIDEGIEQPIVLIEPETGEALVAFPHRTR